MWTDTRRWLAAVVVMSAFVIGACDDDGVGVGARGDAEVSFAVTEGTGTLNGNALTVTDLAGNTLVITRVQLVLSEIELEFADELEDCDSSGPGNPCQELELGPMLVTLPLNGNLITAVDVRIPAGRFEELELEIEVPDENDAASIAFRQANPQFADASVRISGTFNGEPFDLFLDVEAELELEFDDDIEFIGGADPFHITVLIDASMFFRDSLGFLFDPRDVEDRPELRARVEDNIEAAFEAFEDDDRDGEDDD